MIVDRESHDIWEGVWFIMKSEEELKTKLFLSSAYTEINGAPMFHSGQRNVSRSIEFRDTAVSNPNVSTT